VLRLSATDGALQAAATVTITLSQATVPLTFIAKGSTWKYLDDGSNQGTAWRAKTFSDTAWKSGAAELGYGDTSEGRPEVTVVSYGPDANSKYVTTYFRRAFNVTGAASVKNLAVNLMRDDGAVIYLNGTEVFRDNMPADTIDFSTLAINAVGGTDEATFYSQPASPALLVEGVNVLAVEIHQSSRTSSDLSFDLELTGDGIPGNTPPANQQPVVSAGANQTITLPASAQLNGTITDDGLPNPPAQTTASWSKVSGPGTVTFTTPNAASTRASFSSAGTYVLRLTASDGTLQTTSDVTIGVLENGAPVVNAGATQTIMLPAVAQLNATATDDGLPNPPGQLTLSWSKVSGPGTVSFANPAAAATTATFSAPGTYVLRLTANDSALQSTSDVTVRAVQNTPPVVNAGANQTITLPASAQLAGTVTDDGLPNPPATVTVAWSKISGPGTVTFSAPTAAASSASFSAVGTYVLRLSATDGALQTTSDVTITAVQNAPPVVNAGANQTVTLPASAQLTGTATDDGLPNPPGAVTVIWSKVSGPGSVTFTSATTASSSASFSAVGTYVLRLSATDGALQTTSDVTITVVQNSAPVVSAGANQNVNFPGTVQLKGTATDDGLPNPPGATTTTWSKVSGPGTVTFANATSATSTATFSAAGAYILRLTATDGALQTTSDVTITLVQNTAPAVNAGANQSITLPANAQLNGSATDDGYPNPPGALTITWSKLSGSGTVTFGSPSSAVTTAAFSAGGTYVLRLAANDGSLQTTSDVTITVIQNAAPVVNAGANQTVAMPASVHLQGSITDDGLPNPPAQTTVTWSKVSGAGTVTFASANAAITTATFSGIGTYVLRLTGSDGALQSTSDVTITVVENTAPVPSSGDDMTVILPGSAQLTGSVSDDGFPNPPGQITSTWSKVSGLGTVTFANANQPITSASFSAAGSYVLRLTASDGALEASSSVIINVLENTAPVVNTGANQSITLPANAHLSGTVTDDGLPTSPGQVTSSWSKVSGAGTVTFVNPGSPATTASFSAPGTYVLRLTATDGALQSTDEVTITVQDGTTQPLHIETVGIAVNGQNPTLQFSFQTTPFVSYTIQYRDSLVGGSWQKLRDVLAAETAQMMNITDTSIGNVPKRYYRVVSPQQ
jgi:hypothetical protein